MRERQRDRETERERQTDREGVRVANLLKPPFAHPRSVFTGYCSLVIGDIASLVIVILFTGYGSLVIGDIAAGKDCG